MKDAGWLRHVEKLRACSHGLKEARSLRGLAPFDALGQMKHHAIWLLQEIDAAAYRQVNVTPCACGRGAPCDWYARAARAVIASKWWRDRFVSLPANPPLIGWRATEAGSQPLGVPEGGDAPPSRSRGERANTLLRARGGPARGSDHHRRRRARIASPGVVRR